MALTDGSQNGIEHTSGDEDKPLTLGETKTQSRDSELPVVNNVFYNEETHKYMKIIDMYQKLGIGKDIELPRVRLGL
jgi:hypothetical protein